MSTFIVYSRSLPADLSAEVNKTGWDGQIWGPAYLDIGFIRSDDGKLPSSIAASLFILERFGIYRRGYDIGLDAPIARGALTELEELEIVFEAGNISPDHPLLSSFRKWDRIPSISVGDIAFLNDYSKGWICCCVGWVQLPDNICKYWGLSYMNIDRAAKRILEMQSDRALEEVSS
jgi:hypothetical protein